MHVYVYLLLIFSNLVLKSTNDDILIKHPVYVLLKIYYIDETLWLKLIYETIK